MNDLYINIGSKKSCLFVQMSKFLIRTLDKYPFLYYAVEEAIVCAKIKYYGIGIITFSQLLNLFKKRTPINRHIVAHKVLTQRPTKQMYEEILETFKNAASERSKHECKKCGSIADYQQSVLKNWEDFIKKQYRI